MVKITSKLYRPADLLAVIKVLELIIKPKQSMKWEIEAKDIVIDLRKKGYKIVKVDDRQ